VSFYNAGVVTHDRRIGSWILNHSVELFDLIQANLQGKEPFMKNFSSKAEASSTYRRLKTNKTGVGSIPHSCLHTFLLPEIEERCPSSNFYLFLQVFGNPHHPTYITYIFCDIATYMHTYIRTYIHTYIRTYLLKIRVLANLITCKYKELSINSELCSLLAT
jgi:hypothetical protein